MYSGRGRVVTFDPICTLLSASTRQPACAMYKYKYSDMCSLLFTFDSPFWRSSVATTPTQRPAGGEAGEGWPVRYVGRGATWGSVSGPRAIDSRNRLCNGTAALLWTQ